MSDRSYKKSFHGTCGVILKGRVTELKKLYEGRYMGQDERPRSKSESSVLMDKDMELLKSTVQLAETDNTSGMLVSSENTTNKNKTFKEPSESEAQPFPRREGKKHVHFSTQERCKNKALTKNQRNRISTEDELSNLAERNTGTLQIETSILKRPVPAPRVQIIKKQNNENNENLQKKKISQEVYSLLNNNFIDADRSGNIEKLRADLLSIIDEQISEMKSNGFNDNNTFNVENKNSSDESSEEESDKESFDWNIPPIPKRSLQPSPSVNKSEKNVACSTNFDESDDDNYEPYDPNIELESESDKEDEEEINHTIWKNNTQPFGSHNLLDERNINDEDIYANIPPVPNRALKPSLNLNKNKIDIPCNIEFDQSDEEMYEPIGGTFMELQSKEIYPKPRIEKIKLDKENIKLSKIIQEFKETETRYLRKLTEIIPRYKYGIKNHSSIITRTKAQLICTTIDKLLEFQIEFANMMKTSDDSLGETLRSFIEFEELFITYKQCLETNDTLTITIGYSEDDFGKEINLPALLNQRLTHYKMFLERIRREVCPQRNPEVFQIVVRSLNIIVVIINSCNTKLLLSSVQNVPPINKHGSLADGRESEKPFSSLPLQCCPFDVTGYGDFLLKDRFKISKPFSLTVTVFLFQNILLFTTEEKKDTFYYHSHIKMNEIRLMAANKRNKEILELEHFRKVGQFQIPTKYKLKAKNPRIIDIWKCKMTDCFWIQELKLREEVIERYTREKIIKSQSFSN